MNSAEFRGRITPDGQITVPEDIARRLPPGERLHVVLQWDSSAGEDEVWRSQGRRRFEAAYAPEDAVYEQLMDDTPNR